MCLLFSLQDFGIATAPSVQEAKPEPQSPTTHVTETVAAPVTTAIAAEPKLVETAKVSSGYDLLNAKEHPIRAFILGLVALALPAGLFWYCGGMRYVRRLFGGKYQKYRKVDDLEK